MVSTIKLAIKAFEELDMIATTSEGFISVIGWEEYQNVEGMEKIREQNRARKRLQREREKQARLGESQECHVTVTGCHAIEEDIEEEKEKEYHSFNHSNAGEGVDNSWDDGADPQDPFASPKLEYIKGTLGEGYLLMSEVQFNDLCDKLSFDELHKYCSVIVECEKNGKHYKKKSHYQAILDMAMRDRKKIQKG